MRKMDQHDHGMIEKAQKDIAEVKRDLHKLAHTMSSLGANFRAQKDVDAANAVLRFRGSIYAALGEFEKGHADASDALCRCFEEGEVIALGGGGGR